MRLENDKVILRDFIKEDIEDRIRWETSQTEWQLWDAPWESDDEFNIEDYKERMIYFLSTRKNDDSMRHKFEICIKDNKETHIGWCNIYKIDSNFKYTSHNGSYAIGIDIPEIDVRRRGYATASWKLLIEYLISKNITDIYTQTWSGNLRVIGLASKIGFEECHRILNERLVRGSLYDGLTLKLNINKFNNEKIS